MSQIIRIDFALPAGDYTAGAWVEVRPLSQRGIRIERLLLTASGMSAAATVALYEAQEASGALTNAQRADSEIMAPTVVPVAVAPAPSLNLSMSLPVYLQPAAGVGTLGRSLYLFWQSAGADAAVSMAAHVFGTLP